MIGHPNSSDPSGQSGYWSHFCCSNKQIPSLGFVGSQGYCVLRSHPENKKGLRINISFI